MVGVSFMIWRAVHQWRSLERIATRLAYRRAEIEEILLRVAKRFGGMPGARVLVSGFIDTPTLIGWFKPVILLPAAVVAGFPREQLELILAHELGHLRRYDHLVNLGQAVIETLLFYHPVVHWISREVRHEREVCCDNLVLRLTDSEPREYARTLAALEEVRQLAPQLSVAASGGMLLDRVRRIVSSKHRCSRAQAPVDRLLAGGGGRKLGNADCGHDFPPRKRRYVDPFRGAGATGRRRSTSPPQVRLRCRIRARRCAWPNLRHCTSR